MTIQYQDEMKRLDSFKPGESGNFWDPKPGQYKVKSLSELEETDPSPKFPDKKRAKLNIIVDDKPFSWTMSVGVSPASLYGQLCRLATTKKNTLKDVEFMVVVTSDGKKRNFTIVMM